MLTEAEDVETRLIDSAPVAEDSDKPARVDDGRYDGKKREPAFAHAENSCLWELVSHPCDSRRLALMDALAGPAIATLSSLGRFARRAITRWSTHFRRRRSRTTLSQPFPRSIRLPRSQKDCSDKGFFDDAVWCTGTGWDGEDRTQEGTCERRGFDGQFGGIQEQGYRRHSRRSSLSSHFRLHGLATDMGPQLFFHKYFSSKTAQGDEKAKASKKRKSRKGGKDDSSDEESIGDLGFSDKEDEEGEFEMSMAQDEEEEDSEAEAEIWKAMKASMPKKEGDDEMEDEDDEDDSDLEQFNYTDSEDEAPVEQEDQPFKSAFGKEEDEADDGDDGDNLIEDDDDLIGSDEDMPLFGGDMGEGSDGSDTVARTKSQDRKRKKQKLKHLPMFGTAEDYAHLLGASDDDGDEE